MWWLLLADVVLMLHVGFVLFVVLGQVLIITGGLCSWAWVRRRRFRFLHLAAIAVVVVQSWLGMICPLTHLEVYLRQQAGVDAVYAGTFISHWLQTLLYYQAPHWVFVLVYTLFGGLVLCSWWWLPPTPRRSA